MTRSAGVALPSLAPARAALARAALAWAARAWVARPRAALALAALALAALAQAGPAAAWAPSECGAELAAARARSLEMLRNARPGSRLWLPYPYPLHLGELFEDFRVSYLRAMAHAPCGPDCALGWAVRDLLAGRWRPATWQLRLALDSLWPDSRYQRELRFQEALAKRRLSFRADRVEDWTPHRCESRLSGLESYRRTAGTFTYLLRFYDASGTEIARASVHASGQWGQGGLVWNPAGQAPVPAPLPELAEALRRAAARGITGSRPQYVEAYGTFFCAPIAPCVAFVGARGSSGAAGGDAVYLYSSSQGGGLFEIRPDAPRFPAAALAPPRDGSLAPILRHLDLTREAVVTLGFDQVAIARRLDDGR
jgi:hypothetical protein